MTVTERLYVAQPYAGGRGNLIASPFQFLMTGEDNLVCTLWSDQAGFVVDMQGRFLKTSGEIQPFSAALVSDATPAGREALVQLGEGFLLNISVVARSVTMPPGRVFIKVDVVRGSTGARIVLGTLLSGYVTSTFSRAWPGAPLETQFDGPGYLHWAAGVTSGLGTPAVFTLQQLTRVEILAARTTLTTSSGVAARRPRLQVRADAIIRQLFAVPYVVSEGVTLSAFWSQVGGAGLANIGTANPAAAIGASAWAFFGEVLEVTADNLQAGDDLDDTQFLLRQYLDIP